MADRIDGVDGVNEVRESQEDVTRPAGPANATNVPPVKTNPNLTDTGSVVGVSGRKGGATPVALYEDYSQARSYDMTRNLSQNSNYGIWVAILVAVGAVLAILYIASRSLSFPDTTRAPGAQQTAPATTYSQPAGQAGVSGPGTQRGGNPSNTSGSVNGIGTGPTVGSGSAGQGPTH